MLMNSWVGWTWLIQLVCGCSDSVSAAGAMQPYVPLILLGLVGQLGCVSMTEAPECAQDT